MLPGLPTPGCPRGRGERQGRSMSWLRTVGIRGRAGSTDAGGGRRRVKVGRCFNGAGGASGAFQLVMGVPQYTAGFIYFMENPNRKWMLQLVKIALIIELWQYGL